MIFAGLTGSIGMGKSTTAAMFRDNGVPVFDADAAVHALYGPRGAATVRIAHAFPGVVTQEGVNRPALRDRVQGDPAAFARLETIVHPLVARARRRFVRTAKRRGAWLLVFDIPLLFESGGDRRMDVVIVVTVPSAVQRERVLARPGMTEESFEAIKARQVPDAEKRARADFVIDTSRGLAAARRDVRRIIRTLRRRARARR